jgi:hypothetical protein
MEKAGAFQMRGQQLLDEEENKPFCLTTWKPFRRLSCNAT